MCYHLAVLVPTIAVPKILDFKTKAKQLRREGLGFKLLQGLILDFTLI
jgi:hypothetical protein